MQYANLSGDDVGPSMRRPSDDACIMHGWIYKAAGLLCLSVFVDLLFPFVDSSLAPHALMVPRILTYMGILWDSNDYPPLV